jgi:RNA polymerase sigma-70 factor (ECF subfamily)
VDRSNVEAARSGDRSAFDGIVRTEVDHVYRLALAITGNETDAADATQEAFLHAWRHVRELRDPDRFDAWLGRIIVNQARMVLRSRRRRLVREIAVSDVDADARHPHAAAAAAATEDALALRAALARLPADQRVILALRHLEGRGIAEIAAILGVPEGTAKSRLFTARRALEAALAEESADG